MLTSTYLKEFSPVNIKHIFKFVFLVCVKDKSCVKQQQLNGAFLWDLGLDLQWRGGQCRFMTRNETPKLPPNLQDHFVYSWVHGQGGVQLFNLA